MAVSFFLNWYLHMLDASDKARDMSESVSLSESSSVS